MWEIDLADQITSFLLSLPLGIILSVAFFTLEALNIANGNSKIRIWISDILYFAAAGFVTFCYLLLRSNGEVRGYILVGEGIGFLIFKALFSKYYVKILLWIIGFVKSVFDRIVQTVNGFFNKIICEIQKSLKKLENNKKKRLKTEE